MKESNPMQIVRVINGIELKITLTDDEIYTAFVHKQHEFDMMDVEDALDWYEDSDLAEYGVSKKELENAVEDIAYDMRRNIDKYDMTWDYARDEALHSYLYAVGKDRLCAHNGPRQ